MVQITGIGANVYDTLFRLSSYPTEDTKQAAISIAESGGGPCGTGLVAAAKLGAGCAYIGNCSDDPSGQFLMADFAKYGIDTSFMTPVPQTTGFRSCIWLSDDGATRTCVYHRGTVPPTQIEPRAAAAIRESQILMVDGNDLEAAVEGARIARESGTLVLYDAGGQYSGVDRLLVLTDILIPSEAFALGHTGAATAEDAAKMLFAMYRPKVVVITQGKQGGLLYDGKQISHYPSFCVDVVDTNGAGDVFHGAFAYCLTQGYAFEQCCVFSSAVSALKCTRMGARIGTPTLSEVQAFLQQHQTVE